VNEGYIEVDGIRLELSDEAKKQLEESRKKVQEENDNRTLIEIEQQNAESAKKQGEAMEKEMENMAKAIEIFRRMSKGGMVPGKDEKLLMEFDDKMYQTAKSMQLMAERHKKHKRLSEDPEEEEDESLERKTGPRQATEMDVEIEGDSAEVTGVSEVEVDPEG
jgi:transcriptional regulator of heat shock response